ncbi:hypothetical protein [Natranaerobius thermophilus]|uniref:Quinate 5-dehydrogenase n=1 Tax=Natranaerobius thermophilus (strain ATCC BAA-1301 / DSM 18059 / JW/NM-WN-LF) TaxID=457570 RepID=B2A3T7_NATTJ|nr:hypothetical protein [Natranaerobius thermophilus]ACB83713.1 conserved hypothetical protein [Natranaerobius thermophilus JW/NM-WN-LF]
MKRVVSVSLGSSKRNHKVEEEFLGEKVSIERIGTDGDLDKMKQIISELDGEVDAFGLGGMDLYLAVGKYRYMLKDAQKVAQCCKNTPIVDGSGLKNSLERNALQQLNEHHNLFNSHDRVLLVSALDRFGMAEKLSQLHSEVIYGDLIFSLGIPISIRSLHNLEKIARCALPVVRWLPFKLLYPSGSKKNRTNGSQNKYEKYYDWADIICGDFHYINKYLPDNLEEKVIVTNTVTQEDEENLKNCGLKQLITTTPSLKGRSFGTNVMEALLIALKGGKQELKPREYETLLEELNFIPSIKDLN